MDCEKLQSESEWEEQKRSSSPMERQEKTLAESLAKNGSAVREAQRSLEFFLINIKVAYMCH